MNLNKLLVNQQSKNIFKHQTQIPAQDTEDLALLHTQA